MNLLFCRLLLEESLGQPYLVLVAVNADVSESIGGRHDWNPILVRLERLLQVHHRRGGQVAPEAQGFEDGDTKDLDKST